MVLTEDDYNHKYENCIVGCSSSFICATTEQPKSKNLCNKCINVIKRFQKCKLMNYSYEHFIPIKRQISTLLLIANRRHVISKNVIVSCIIPYFINNFLK